MECGQTYYVDDSAVLRNVEAKQGAKIYKNTFLSDCKLEEGVSIGDFTRAENCEFGEESLIQRNGMLYTVKFGRLSYTGKNFTAWHCEIGSFCSISWNVSIGGANHDYTRVTTHSFLYSDDFGLMGEHEGYDRFSEPCVIGNDVWIAANACICRGVTIGDGAVIAAGAVVTHDVEPYTIVAGVPARPIKKRFDDNVISLLLKSRWWELPGAVIREHFDLFNSKADVKTARKILELAEKTENKRI